MSFRLRYIFCGLIVGCIVIWYYTTPSNIDGGVERVHTDISSFSGLYDVNSPFIFIGNFQFTALKWLSKKLDLGKFGKLIFYNV